MSGKESFETGMLAFSRSVQITEGLFFGVPNEKGSDHRIPVEVLEKGVRGQTSQANAKGKEGLSNPQSVEFAALPQGCEGVELQFALRVMPNAMKPHACGNTEVGRAYAKLAEAYREFGGFQTLAERYVWNIANARFAWRNRFQSDEMNVTVKFDNKVIVFNPFALDLEKPSSVADLKAAAISGSEHVEDLVSGFAMGLSREAFAAKVIWFARMEPGQEVFPSQEYVREEKADANLSRVFAKLPTAFAGRKIAQASMHSQKIGAALRHIDDWHGNPEYAAIAVNPYGGVQETGAVLRGPKTKKSFYDLRAKADVLFKGVGQPMSDDVHFVMANLVRGGVFGSSSAAAEKNG